MEDPVGRELTSSWDIAIELVAGDHERSRREVSGEQKELVSR
jgi:hypothetical protein